MNSEHLLYEELVIRYLCNDVSSSEKNTIETLLKEDKVFKEEFEKYRQIWSATELLTLDTEQDWKNIKQRISFSKEKTQSSPIFFFMKIAAVLIIVFSVSIGLWRYWNVPGNDRWLVFETGSTADSVILPDESVVFLNRNSSLKFKKTFFGNERKVSLTGEGYFEVSQDINKPFNVEIGDVSVKVLGTAFNIDGKRADGNIELNVTRGKVLFKNKSENITVKEGEWAVMGTKLINRGIIDDPNFLSWKTGKIEFNNANMENVVKTLSKNFHEIKSVKFDKSINILVTTKFTDCSLPDILDELSLLFEKKFVLKEGILIISD